MAEPELNKPDKGRVPHTLCPLCPAQVASISEALTCLSCHCRWQSRLQSMQDLLEERSACMDAEVVKRDYALLKAQKQLIFVQVTPRSAHGANMPCDSWSPTCTCTQSFSLCDVFGILIHEGLDHTTLECLCRRVCELGKFRV